MEITFDEALERARKWQEGRNEVVVTGYVRGTQFVFTFTGRVMGVEGAVVTFHGNDGVDMKVPLGDAYRVELILGEDLVSPPEPDGTVRQFEGGIVAHAMDSVWSCSIYELKRPPVEALAGETR